MSRLVWGEVPPIYNYGVDQGVLYLDSGAVSWDGLVSVAETTESELDANHYFEGRLLHISEIPGDFTAKIGAYTYPDVFAEYNGYTERQTYRRFGFSYRVQLAHSYQIHLVYDVLVRDDSRVWVTDTQSPQPSVFSWDIYSANVKVDGARPTAHLILEAQEGSNILEQVEDILYGTPASEPRLPMPNELIELYESATLLKIVNNQDGTWTASGPDDVVRLLPDGRFEIDAPSAYFLNPDRFVVSSI